nr:ribonuclease H-like domain-containing protein [Tanacetum cinerariifolium]
MTIHVLLVRKGNNTEPLVSPRLCDNGTEFKTSDLNHFCGLKGIKREFSIPRTPQQNGIAERKNRTLIEAVRTLLADSLLPIPFWVVAVNTACYVQNRVLVTKPHNKTPYELLHGRLPSIGFMRPFGCLVIILNTLKPLGKFQGKVDEGFLVGYSVCSKAFRVFNSRTRIVHETLHVNFMENKPDVAGSGPAWLFDIDSLTRTMNYHPVISENQTNSNASFQDTEKVREEGTQTYVLFLVLFDDSTNSQNKNKDEHDDDIQKSVSTDIHSSSSGAQTRKQGDKTENKDNVSLIPTTRTHKDHLTSQIISDLSSTTQTRSMRAIGTKWVYRKKDERGIVIRNKARLVAQVHTQEEGIDYEDVFSPVARIEAIRLFLAYASFMGFLVYQMDVKSAFLYGTIEEEVYVCQPPGFEDPKNPDKVVKALYGLHQAHRAWVFNSPMLHLLRVETVINSPWMLSKNWLVQKQTAFELASPKANDSCDSPPLGVNTPRSDEDRLKLMELMVFLLQNGHSSAIFLEVASLFFSQWEPTSLAVGSCSGSGNFIVSSGNALYILFPTQCCRHTREFWKTASVKRSGDVTRLQALVDKKKIVLSGVVIHEILQIDDAEGVNQVGDLSTYTTRFISLDLTQKVFANMRRVGKGFSGVEIPLFEGMLADTQPAEEGLVDEQVQVDDDVDAVFEENVAEDVAHDKLVIIKLKARVKRLEKANMVKSSKLRRLGKVGASRRIDSADDMEDVFNQGRMIDDMDNDEGIELVKDADIAKTEGSAASATISAAKPSIPAAAPIVVAAYTRRRKGVIIRDPEEKLSSKTPAETPKVKDKGKGILVETPKPIKKKEQIELDAEYARKLHEEINKDHEEFNKDMDWDATMDHVNQKSKNPQYIKRYQGIKKSPQTESEAHKNMMIYLKNIAGYKMDFFKGMTYAQICPIFQARFDKNMRFLFKSREEMEEEDLEVIKSINETLVQKATKRRKLSEEAQEAKDLRNRLEVVDDEDDDVFIEATPLAREVPFVDYQIVLVDNKPRFKIIKADETPQLYISFTTLLKNFDIKDLENL